MNFAITNESPGFRVRWEIDMDYRLEEPLRFGVEDLALGAIVEARCCECGQWKHIDSLWGIVIEPRAEALEAFARENLEGVA